MEPGAVLGFYNGGPSTPLDDGDTPQLAGAQDYRRRERKATSVGVDEGIIMSSSPGSRAPQSSRRKKPISCIFSFTGHFWWTSPPHTLPLDAFGVSISALSAPRFPTQIPGYAYDCVTINIVSACSACLSLVATK